MVSVHSKGNSVPSGRTLIQFWWEESFLQYEHMGSSVVDIILMLFELLQPNYGIANIFSSSKLISNRWNGSKCLCETSGEVGIDICSSPPFSYLSPKYDNWSFNGCIMFLRKKPFTRDDKAKTLKESKAQQASWRQHRRGHHGVGAPAQDKLTSSRGERKTGCFDKRDY